MTRLRSTSATRRRYLPIATAALVLGLLASVEFAAGLLVPAELPSAEIAGDQVSQTLAWLDINPAPLVASADLLWKNEPGARRTRPVNPRPYAGSEEWSIENDARGFRRVVREGSSKGPVLRVLCVGDSITFGFNVDQADHYPQQLQRILERQLPGRKIEVINAGVSGWSWLQGLRFLETEGLALDPDIVVMGHGTNDQLSKARTTDEERFLRLGTPLRRALMKASIVASRTNTFRALARVLGERDGELLSPGCRAQSEGGEGYCHRVSLGEITEAVLEAAEVTRKAGARILMVNTDFIGTAAVQGLERAVRQEGIPYLNLVDELDERRRAAARKRSAEAGLAPPGTVRRASGERFELLLRVAVPSPAGSYTVQGRRYLGAGDEFQATMRDDGRGGDEVAGDGVASASVAIPEGVTDMEYRYALDGIPEFQPLPPLSSSLGRRIWRGVDGTPGPVDVFGVNLYMTEQTHPNAAGHDVIATLVADAILDLLRSRD